MTLNPGNHDVWLVQENVRIHLLFLDWSDDVRDHKVDFPLLQGASGCIGIDVKHLKDEAGISAGEPVDDGANEAHRSGDGSSNSHFPGRWIGEEFNVLDALPELIESRDPSIDDRAAIWSCLDAPRAPIKKTHAKSVLQVCDRS